MEGRFIQRITSPHNPKYRAWLALRSRGERESRGAFILDGEHLAREAVSSGAAVSLMLDERRLDRFPPDIDAARASGVEVFALAAGLYERLTDTPSPQGIAAEARLPGRAPASELGTRVVVLDGVQDPGNVGAIIRTADAAGVTGILLTRTCADPFSAKAVRASMGSIWRVPLCIDEDVEGVVRGCQRSGLRVLAADARGDDYRMIAADEPYALVVGSEGQGVSPGIVSLADTRVSIPMRSPVESLNASAAASILIYALARL